MPGHVLRQADLKARQWFAAGDTVRIVGAGPGFAISSDGLALSPGIEGQPVKVRTEGGRVVVGRATAARQVEVAL
jgi:flagella basal body P-ring formation protein FlgA